MTQLSFHSPLGDLTLTDEGGRIISLDWGWARDQGTTPLLQKAKKQVLDYLQGRLRKFDLPVDPPGTAFQRSVWRQMQAIPFGKTRSYAELAARLKSGPRAVGGACGKNPIPIIIPCHRVVGSGGGLGGFSSPGGVDTKKRLLSIEGGAL
ncbi:MAG: methylated-DNA--[protein]-cysteine S-methyltransferase [Rhodospirillales bacterium]|nr:methylated-DNA--[protein]-cysteine S-methyltransferase [Rhodospirillales bacterium]